MKNYYEILEVDKKASKEIIDKAYRTLVKKYHPDLKEHTEKTDAEAKIKEINEAYDILSDKEKREEYNKTLQNSFISIDKYNLLIEENRNLKLQLKKLENTILSKLNQNDNSNNTTSNQTYTYTEHNNYSNNMYNNYTSNNKKNIYHNNNNHSKTSPKKSILNLLFSILQNIFTLISRYFFIVLILFILFIIIRKYFFNTVFDIFEFKDLLILAGIIFFLIYTFKQK